MSHYDLKRDEIIAVIDAINKELDVQSNNGLCFHIRRALGVSQSSAKLGQFRLWMFEWDEFSGDDYYPIPYTSYDAACDRVNLEEVFSNYVSFDDTFEHLYHDNVNERFYIADHDTIDINGGDLDDFDWASDHDNEASYAEIAYENLNKWEGAYGEARIRYANYLIEKLTELLEVTK